jgi:ATP-dependent helicase/nuclease subunit A
LISTDALAERDDSVVSNLFAVGDVKQSIYAFRMADPSGFVRRAAALSAMPAERGSLIELNENFRSRPALLHGINTICERLMSTDTCDIDYSNGHALSRGADMPESPDGFTGSPIAFHFISDASDHADHDAASDATSDEDDLKDLEIAEREAQLIAVRIAHMMGLQGEPPKTIFDPHEKRMRPIRYSDIAVLLRTARQRSSEIAGVLRRCGIPVHSDDPSGFFNAIEVLDVCSLVEVLDHSRRDIPLAALIRSPFLQIDRPEDLLVEVREKYKHLPFGEALHRASRGDSELAERLRKDVLSPIRRWRELFRLLPVDAGLQAIFDETGFSSFNAGLIDSEQRLANIAQLIALARSFASFERQGISRFAAFLRDLRNDAELPTPPQTGGVRDCVRVMTVHRAKGLEFPVVFLPLLGKKYNDISLRDPVLIDRNVGFGVKAYDASRHIVFPSPATLELKQSIKRAAIAEELRIFYVALTRAREHLELIATDKPIDREALLAQWAAHQGPLPAEMVLDANKLSVLMLAVESIAHTRSPGTIQFHPWTPTRAGELLQEINFSSLSNAGSTNVDLTQLDRAIEAIHWTYPQHPLTTIDSARSVTSLKAAETLPANIIDERLARPRLALSGEHVSALDRGSATHTVLQFIRPDALLSRASIDAEIDRIIKRRWLDPDLRSAVDVDALLWLGSLDLHRLALQPGAEFLREIPIYAGVAPEGYAISDPSDQVLRRGRIDAMIITSDRVHVIDYKTDRITADAVPERAQFYATQIRAYADAVSRWIDRPVATHLIFMTPRTVVTNV